MNREVRRALKTNDKKYRKAIDNFVRHPKLNEWAFNTKLESYRKAAQPDLEATIETEKENN